MPTETVIFISTVVAMFVIFAGVLAWTDHHARGYPHKPAE